MGVKRVRKRALKVWVENSQGQVFEKQRRRKKEETAWRREKTREGEIRL